MSSSNVPPLTWKSGGLLMNSNEIHETGVYVFVYHGIHQRIIYVGTTENMMNRWGKHLKNSKRGLFTIFRPDPDLGEDIYSVMSYHGLSQEYHYKTLSEQGKIWIPSKTSNETGIYCDHHYGMQNFQEDWLPYVIDSYLPKIEMWYCVIEKRYMKILESQIQIALGNKFNLSFYIQNQRQNWLGKKETHDLSILKAHSFLFNNYPPVDSVTLDVLENIQSYI